MTYYINNRTNKDTTMDRTYYLRFIWNVEKWHAEVKQVRNTWIVSLAFHFKKFWLKNEVWISLVKISIFLSIKYEFKTQFLFLILQLTKNCQYLFFNCSLNKMASLETTGGSDYWFLHVTEENMEKLVFNQFLLTLCIAPKASELGRL